jgi:transglutaminase-like putative cysteine protease
MKFNYIVFGILCFAQTVFAQKLEYSYLLIDEGLKENANAVVRLNESTISITAQNAMTIQSKVITTVLNDFGLRTLNLLEYYDKNRKISKLDVTVYDGLGKEIKSFKKKDFADISVADGFSVFDDSRALVLGYVPISYPFTVVFETVLETSNTAFIPSWRPIDDYYVSTEKTTLTLNFKPELKLNVKEENFSTLIPVDKKETSTSKSYTSTAIKARKKEELAPSFTKVFPIVSFALENFYLENVQGNASNWNEFGKWYYKALLEDTEEISAQTIQKLKKLIGNEKNQLEIAKIVYKFVQEKTRYVSVQVGIGGWKPMLAADVDKLGYGDCKALTNYTRVLLRSVDIPSYYTIVYAGNERRNIKEDISSVQGNHVILTIPIDNKMIWLECTSQIHPFGFQGDFTDDRDVLIIKPDGGEIIKTKTYTENDNLKRDSGFYSLTESGTIKASLKMVSYGIQYDKEFLKERLSKEDQIKTYKEEFSHINNLKINKSIFQNDKNKIEFTEELEFEAENYAQNMGGKLMFALNAFSQSTAIPKKHRNRELPFEIQRGYTDEDETIIEIPADFQVEAMPNNVELTTEFGSYSFIFKVLANQKIECKRKLIINKGFYESSKFEEYRKFRETIGRTDNSKVVISKT